MRLLGLIYPLPDTVVITVAAWVSNTVAFLPCTVCVCVCFELIAGKSGVELGWRRGITQSG